MASSSERRKGFWGEDEESEDSQFSAPSPADKSAADSELIHQKIHDAKVLLEQTHQLYQQYFNGVERRVPIEKVQQLESKVLELKQFSNQGTTNKFKISQFVQQYLTMKDLWARKLKEKERK